MRSLNRALSLLLAAVIILTCAPCLLLRAGASGYSGSCGEKLTWTFEEDAGCLTISGTGTMDSFGYSDNPEWCDEGLCEKIGTLVLESGVEEIGAWSMFGCTGLETVRFADTVTTIGECAFYGCKSLESLTIPDSVAVIGDNAFCGCDSLETLVFLGDAPELDDAAFDGRTLTCYYPSEMAGWDDDGLGQFGGKVTWTAYTPGQLPELDDTIVEEDGEQDSGGLRWDFDPDDGTLTIRGKGEMEDEWAPWGPGGAELHEEIRSIKIGKGVQRIGAYAFEECVNLERITIPGNVTEIGSCAFSMCESLTEVELCEGVEVICDEVFVDCFNLTSVTLPESLKRVGYGAFSWSGIEEICFLGNAPEFDEEAFYGLEAAVCYPENDSTWTEEIRRDYGGSITWKIHGAAQSVIPGDVDSSGSVDYFDGMYVLQYYAGVIDETQLNAAAADVDSSGDVNFFDGMYILQYYAGSVEKLPVEG